MHEGVSTESACDSRVEAAIEVLCAQGCRQVRRVIAALESGRDVPEVQSLTPSQRLRLLAELSAIMAVYGDSCRLD